jgi:hypothetical protein
MIIPIPILSSKAIVVKSLKSPQIKTGPKVASAVLATQLRVQ